MDLALLGRRLAPRRATGVILLAVIAMSAFAGYYLLTRDRGQKSPVEVLYAGSLVPLMETGIGPAFASSGYGFKGEGHGSVANANLVIDGQRSPDVFVSAGVGPLQKLIQNTPKLASWYVAFAADQIVIAYGNRSRFANSFDEARKGALPWYQVLAEKDFRFLRSDPELDPKGYYTIIVAELADGFYHNSSVSSLVLRGDRNPDQLRPEEVLVTLLETGEADAIPVYKHEAVERGLRFLSLPAEINLGSPELATTYSQAGYTFEDGTVVKGAPIVFVVTIPKTVRNVAGASDFVVFLLSERGQQILRDDGFGPLVPIAGGDLSDIPVQVAKLVRSAG